MQILPLIRTKRAGEELSTAQIRRLVAGVVDGSAPDYQLAALLMAICYEGLSVKETKALTRAIVESGEQLDWSQLTGPVLDKHSTGGVGDKVTLILVPWLAACGLKLPKLSGRGLGHTGGTIDKLESIPGFDTSLSTEQVSALLDNVGCMVAGQTAELAPADKRLYALRDATGTVDELGLIVASVMGKKLAAGAEHILLDVKVGQGAFFAAEDQARQFAELAVEIGSEFERKVACVLSRMDQPLGSAVGNAMEVAEAYAFLAGRAENYPDLYELCGRLAESAFLLAGVATDQTAARKILTDVLASGAARQRFEEWVSAQGGDLRAFGAMLTQSGYQRVEVLAPATGYVKQLAARRIGELARKMGAGRRTKDDVIDPLVGIECLAKVGMTVAAGQVIARLHLPPLATNADELVASYLDAVEISSAAVAEPGVVLGSVLG